jgi:sulfite reductase (NADPH) flavoprotein alpha-component
VNRRLSGPESEKDTRHFELDLTGWGLSFEVGDSLAVYASNDPELVDEIIHTLGATGDEQVPRPRGNQPHFAKRYCAITASPSQRPSF